MGNNEDEINKRSYFFSTLTKSILKELQDMLHINNEKIKNIKYALERNNEPDFKLVIKEDCRPSNEHERRFNRPTNNEIVIVMIGDITIKRDIIIINRDSTVQRIKEIHPAYDCLQYPLINCKGEDTWDINMRQTYATKFVCMRYYAYIIIVRENDKNVLLQFRELLHQYITDMYSKIEEHRLVFIRFNQGKLRTDSYDNIKDAMNNDEDIDNLGYMVILPSSYTGSLRYMQECKKDAMTYDATPNRQKSKIIYSQIKRR